VSLPRSIWSYQASEKQLTQIDYPTAAELNSIRYSSSVAYEFATSAWTRVVSVPFLSSGSELRGVVAVTVWLNNLDLKQCKLSANVNGSELAKESLNTDKCDRETTEVKLLLFFLFIRKASFNADFYFCEKNNIVR
jgi:hypothetical protein